MVVGDGRSGTRTRARSLISFNTETRIAASIQRTVDVSTMQNSPVPPVLLEMFRKIQAASDEICDGSSSHTIWPSAAASLMARRNGWAASKLRIPISMRMRMPASAARCCASGAGRTNHFLRQSSR